VDLLASNTPNEEAITVGVEKAYFSGGPWGAYFSVVEAAYFSVY